jgi:hypothetical protein
LGSSIASGSFGYFINYMLTRAPKVNYVSKPPDYKDTEGLIEYYALYRHLLWHVKYTVRMSVSM